MVVYKAAYCHNALICRMSHETIYESDGCVAVFLDDRVEPEHFYSVFAFIMYLLECCNRRHWKLVDPVLKEVYDETNLVLAVADIKTKEASDQYVESEKCALDSALESLIPDLAIRLSEEDLKAFPCDEHSETDPDSVALLDPRRLETHFDADNPVFSEEVAPAHTPEKSTVVVPSWVKAQMCLQCLQVIENCE